VAEADRRPIAAREWQVSRQAAAWLAARGVGANAISLAGMASGIAASLALAATHPPISAGRAAWLVAALLILARLAANMLDGMVALARGTASKLGELYNEAPDRISDSAILIGLGYAAGGDVVLGYAGALAALLTAYVRVLGKAAGAPQEFCGPMAKQQRMALVILAALWGALSDPQDPPVAALVAFQLVILIGSLGTAARRLRRIAAKLAAAP
jgi:phosphatidylglycerophosphate synthase